MLYFFVEFFLCLCRRFFFVPEQGQFEDPVRAFIADDPLSVRIFRKTVNGKLILIGNTEHNLVTVVRSRQGRRALQKDRDILFCPAHIPVYPPVQITAIFIIYRHAYNNRQQFDLRYILKKFKIKSCFKTIRSGRTRSLKTKTRSRQPGRCSFWVRPNYCSSSLAGLSK